MSTADRSARFLRGLSIVLVVAAAVGVGFAAGRLDQNRLLMTTLLIEATGDLTQRIELLSLLRAGDSNQAIRQLENQVDTLVESLAANGVERSALAAAKAYRKVVPPPPERREAMAAIFKSVPDVKMEHCATGLRQLLERESRPNSVDAAGK